VRADPDVFTSQFPNLQSNPIPSYPLCTALRYAVLWVTNYLTLRFRHGCSCPSRFASSGTYHDSDVVDRDETLEEGMKAGLNGPSVGHGLFDHRQHHAHQLRFSLSC
jgi:hypothetical protein